MYLPLRSFQSEDVGLEEARERTELTTCYVYPDPTALISIQMYLYRTKGIRMEIITCVAMTHVC